MLRFRPIEPDDLQSVAALYAHLEHWRSPRMPGYIDFFRRVLLEAPTADPDLTSIVCEDSRNGVIGFIACHARRFEFDGRRIRAVCFGPIIVDHRRRREGLATELLRRLLDGPQDMTFNDRSIDHVHDIWGRLGATTDAVASSGWVRVLAPAGWLVDRAARGLIARGRMPGGATLARVDSIGAGGRNPRAEHGLSEPLAAKDLIDLLSRLDSVFPLRPAYDERYLNWLFETMAVVDMGGNVIRRLVIDDDGRPLGAYVMLVRKHGHAYVMQVASKSEDAKPVLDHLIHDAAAAGAVTVRGRVESFLLPHLAACHCRFERVEWAGVQSDDRRLVDAVLRGSGLVTRMDGEWWMRPSPLGSSPDRSDKQA